MISVALNSSWRTKGSVGLVLRISKWPKSFAQVSTLLQLELGQEAKRILQVNPGEMRDEQSLIKVMEDLLDATVQGDRQRFLGLVEPPKLAIITTDLFVEHCRQTQAKIATGDQKYLVEKWKHGGLTDYNDPSSQTPPLDW